jgi:hypothetical protein
MRTRLACHVSLHRFGVWRAAVSVLAMLSLASLAAWAVAGQGQWSAAALAMAGLAALGVVVLAASLMRVECGALSLENGHWTFAPGGAGVGQAQSGRIGVALDLGSFMLLSFRPILPSGGTGARRWLPAQRRGQEHDWHALRCAVYSPRPADAGPRAGSPAPPE